MKFTASILLGLLVLFMAGCSGQEKLPVAGEGGTPPPFKAKIQEAMAKKDAAQAKGGDRPSAKPTAVPGSN